MTASAQPSAVSAPTELRESPAAGLRRRQAEMRTDATHALDSLTARMAALAAEAIDLASIRDVFPQKVIDGLTQFANNTAGSVDIVTSAFTGPKR